MSKTSDFSTNFKIPSAIFKAKFVTHLANTIFPAKLNKILSQNTSVDFIPVRSGVMLLLKHVNKILLKFTSLHQRYVFVYTVRA